MFGDLVNRDKLFLWGTETLNLTEGDMLAQNKSGWKLIKYIDIKEEDIGQYHNVTGRYLLNYESVDFTGFS